MRLIFLGTPAFALPSLEELTHSAHTIAGVVTQPDRPKGRGKQPAAPPIQEAAQTEHISVHQPTDLKDPAFLQAVRALKPDAAAVVAYGRFLPKVFLGLFPKGVFNLHASMLPLYRGAAPIQWTIIRGETSTGVTIFQLDEQLDHGPIVLQAKQPIRPEDDAISVCEALAQLGAKTIVQAMDLIQAGKANFTLQDHSAATYAPTLRKEDGVIRWEEECRTIQNLVRGVQPWPGAMTWWDRRMLKLFLTYTSPMRPGSGATSGTVVCADSPHGLWVQTGKGQLRIDRLQLEGGQILAAADFLRGHPIPVGTVLGRAHA